MPADLVTEFTAGLDDNDVGWSRAESDAFASVLAEEIERPAVGAALPFADVSLPDEVTTAPTADQLRNAATGVTAAGAGIASYGTLVIQSRPGGDEPISLYPSRHVAVLRESDLVADVGAALAWLDGEFEHGRDSAVFATGISATADMGATVYGVHGPREVHVILLTDR